MLAGWFVIRWLDRWVCDKVVRSVRRSVGLVCWLAVLKLWAVCYTNRSNLVIPLVWFGLVLVGNFNFYTLYIFCIVLRCSLTSFWS